MNPLSTSPFLPLFSFLCIRILIKQTIYYYYNYYTYFFFISKGDPHNTSIAFRGVDPSHINVCPILDCLFLSTTVNDVRKFIRLILICILYFNRYEKKKRNEKRKKYIYDRICMVFHSFFFNFIIFFICNSTCDVTVHIITQALKCALYLGYRELENISFLCIALYY